MKSSIKIAALAALALVAGCGHSGTVPTTPSTGASDIAFPQDVGRSIVVHGNFTEYSLPPGVNPLDLTRGPFDTVWFTPTVHTFTPAKVYQMNDATGHVVAFSAPTQYDTWGNAIVTYNGLVTYVVVNHNIPQDAFYFAQVTPQGHYSFFGAPYFEDIGPSNLVIGADGGLWFGWCIDPCGPGNVDDTTLDSNFLPSFVTPGPGGNIYATAINSPAFPGPDSRVYVISLAGAILHRFNFPQGSGPKGITTGSDHNLWITEPGINKIARMTPLGSIKQFSLPTANAGPDHIVAGYDFALYFTETNANKIGRITTTGAITEYKIPTANSQSTGITPCSPKFCGIHGGVWFTETNGNKIGRFNAPI